MSRKHAHYFRSVSHLDEIDIYRLLDLFNVTDQALGHAIKKLVAPGGRGAGKDFRKDVQEAIDTLQRRLEMLDEDESKNAVMEVTGMAAAVKCCGQPFDCHQRSCTHRAKAARDAEEGWTPVAPETARELGSRRVEIRFEGDPEGFNRAIGCADLLNWQGVTDFRVLP